VVREKEYVGVYEEIVFFIKSNGMGESKYVVLSVDQSENRTVREENSTYTINERGQIAVEEVGQRILIYGRLSPKDPAQT